MYFRKKTSGGRAYLQIVESRRDGAQVRQQVIATLGRIEDLRDSGQLERLLRSINCAGGVKRSSKRIISSAPSSAIASLKDGRPNKSPAGSGPATSAGSGSPAARPAILF